MARSVPPYLYLAGASLLLLAVILFNFSSCLGPSESNEKRKVEKVEKEPVVLEKVDFEITPSSFDELPNADKLTGFSLSDLSKPSLGKKQKASINNAIAAIEEQGDVGVVFVNTKTGRGITHAPTTTIYGASSYKAPYALYVCEQLVEPGTISLDTFCPVSYAIDKGSYYGNSGHSGYPVGELITAAVENSDNNAFGFLRDSYDSLGYDEWATSLGATDALYRADSWFPWYSAESSVRIWTEMFNYLNSGTETAIWLRERLLNTNVSCIRDGIAGEDATVMNKAGWMADPDPNFNSLSDAAVIEADGETYIMSLLSGMPDSTANRALMSSLAAALFDAREALVLQEVSGS